MKKLSVVLVVVLFIAACGELPEDSGPWAITAELDEMTGITTNTAQLVRDIQGGFAFIELACSGDPNQARYEILTQTTTLPDTADAIEIEQAFLPPGFEELEALYSLSNPAGFFNLTIRVDQQPAEELELFPRTFRNGFSISRETDDIDLSALLNADKVLLRFTTLPNNFSTENTISIDQSSSQIRRFINSYCVADDVEASAPEGASQELGDMSETIEFGDDSSDFAFDRECDDPRFEGDGMAILTTDDNLLRDATDCREAFESGLVRLKNN